MSEIVLAHFPLHVRQSQRADREEDSNFSLAQKPCNAQSVITIFSNIASPLPPSCFVRLPLILANIPVFEQLFLINVTEKVVFFKASCTFCLDAKGGTYFIPQRSGEPVIPAITAQSPALIININVSAASPLCCSTWSCPSST